MRACFQKNLSSVLLKHRIMWLNSFPNKKILDLPKLKAFVEKIYVTREMKFVLGRVENIVGKGENAGYQLTLAKRQ